MAGVDCIDIRIGNYYFRRITVNRCTVIGQTLVYDLETMDAVLANCSTTSQLCIFKVQKLMYISLLRHLVTTG